MLSGYLRSIKKGKNNKKSWYISVYLPTRLARDDTSLTPWPDTIKLKSLVLTLPFYFLSQTDIANVSFFVFPKGEIIKQFSRERKKRNFSAAVGFFEPIRDKRDGYYWLLSSWRVYVQLYSLYYIYFFLAFFFSFSFFTSWPSLNRVRARLTSVFLFRPYPTSLLRRTFSLCCQS